jgi:hypothetical protein
MSTTLTRLGRTCALSGALLAIAACKPASTTVPVTQSSAPALSGAPTATYTPPASSQPVNPPTPGAPPANAGDVQANKGLGPGGPVNTPSRLHRRHDSTDGERG